MKSLKRVAAFAAVTLPASGPAYGQTDNVVLPAGAMTWHYECKPDSQCPTRCAVNATELFTTANYRSLMIVQIGDRAYWLRVDTGSGNVDYITRADQVTCSIAGATLTSARAHGSTTTGPAPRP